jgi:hypothetical protein
VPTDGNPGLSGQDKSGAIEMEGEHGGSTYQGQTDDQASVLRPADVFVPILVPIELSGALLKWSGEGVRQVKRESLS